jgi:membrane-bound lytic murein transglycosylase D
VPRSAHKADDVPEKVADSAMMLLAPERQPGRRISFKAGKGGDSVASVAKRYRVSAEQVASWNGVSTQARFQPGQTVIVMQSVPARKQGSTRAARSAPSRATAAAKPSTRPASGKMAASKADSKL